MTPFSIFVVEDEESVRYGISLALEGKYRVRVFPDAESAIPAVRENAPDLVLMDIGLPGMNGIDALKDDQGNPPRSGRPRHHRLRGCPDGRIGHEGRRLRLRPQAAPRGDA